MHQEPPKPPPPGFQLMDPELFRSTYGAQIMDAIRNRSRVTVNWQLKKIGYSMGQQMAHDILTRNQWTTWVDMWPEKVAWRFKEYLGVKASAHYTSHDKMQFQFDSNPLDKFVEITDQEKQSHYRPVICEAIRGALEVMHIDYSTQVISDIPLIVLCTDANPSLGEVMRFCAKEWRSLPTKRKVSLIVAVICSGLCSWLILSAPSYYAKTRLNDELRLWKAENANNASIAYLHKTFDEDKCSRDDGFLPELCQQVKEEIEKIYPKTDDSVNDDGPGTHRAQSAKTKFSVVVNSDAMCLIENTTDHTPFINQTKQRSKSMAEEGSGAAESVKNVAVGAKDSVFDAASSAKVVVIGKTEDAVENVKKGAQDVKDKAHEKASRPERNVKSVESELESAVDSAKDKAEEAVDFVKSKAGEAKDAVNEKTGRFRHDVEAGAEKIKEGKVGQGVADNAGKDANESAQEKSVDVCDATGQKVQEAVKAAEGDE